MKSASGIDSGVTDPFLDVLDEMASQTVMPHQAAAIDAVRRELSRHWRES